MTNNPLLGLSRQQLAQLCREYMIAAQINSRVGYARIRMNHGDAAYLDVAIPNWMAASPVYTRRMQQTMGFAGEHTVKEIFKGLQLECGFSHQYFDVNFELDAPNSGRFWLDSCGALLETEPRGDLAVKVMCHDIEDPTFDATAIATNPRARMHPLHRPPRAPGSEGPVCAWQVTIDEHEEPLPTPLITEVAAQSELARVGLEDVLESIEPGGMDDYSGDLLGKMTLEVFSQKALATIAQELALQNNLLIRTMLMVVADKYSETSAQSTGEFQMIGSARLVSERLSRLFDRADGGIAAIADILPLHPAFQPLSYSQLHIQLIEDEQLAVELRDGPALAENDLFGWVQLLCAGSDKGLESLVQGIDRSARCIRDAANKNRWLVSVGHPIEEDDPLPVQVGRGALAVSFKLQDTPDLIRFVD